MQIFASHAIGGIVGNLLTAIFAQASVAHFDGTTNIPGGWLDHHYIQLAWHIADSAAGLSYSFVMTVSTSHPILEYSLDAPLGLLLTSFLLVFLSLTPCQLRLYSDIFFTDIDNYPLDHALYPRS